MADKVVQLKDINGNNVFPVSQKNITLTDTDPGEGVALAADNYIAVYGNASSLLDVFYPVGSKFETYDTSFNPNNSIGGTWTEVTDYTLVAYACTKPATTLLASKNISSIANGSTGVYTITFSKAMADTKYIVNVNSEASGIGVEIAGVYDKTTTNFKIDFSNHSGTALNQSELNISVYGRFASPDSKTWKRIA